MAWSKTRRLSFQPGLNVRKAVSIAGGLKERGSVSKIFVVRDKDPTHQPVKVDLNADVGPGDTITVEEFLLAWTSRNLRSTAW
jgi:hypothetical protein